MTFFTLASDSNQAPTWSYFLLYGALFAIMYFIVLRPQKKKLSDEKKFQEQLEVNTKVLTKFGVFGVIKEKKEFSFLIEISPNTDIEVLKSQISNHQII